MKKNYLLLFTFFLLISANAQIINIPDANFKAKLLETGTTNEIAKDANLQNIKIDINGDGEIQLSEALNVHYLTVRESNISSVAGIKSFGNLIDFKCGQNNISFIDLSEMLNLKVLWCEENQISTLNLSGSTNLVELYCAYNQLVSLDLKGLNVLKSISCSDNPITNVESTAYSTLLSFNCINAKLTNLDLKKFTNLTGLYCSNNELSSLDLKSMVKLEFIHCDGNKLTSLDLTDQVNLSWILCMNNLLTDIKLPEKMDVLNVSNNPVTSLDLTNSKIKFIAISQTPLKSIDMSNTESNFYIDENPFLETLFIKDGFIANADNGTFLSENPNLKYICADEDEILLMKKMIGIAAECDVNSYCSFIPGGESFTIQGNNKNDINNNGCDASDAPVSFLKFKIDDGIKSGNFISDETGYYSINVPAGSYTISPVFENAGYFSVSPPSLQVDFPVVSSPFTQNFCVAPQGIYNDLETTILSLEPARPGVVAKYKIVYKNKGNTIQSGTVNLFFNDAALNMTSASTAVSSQTQNNLSWNFSSLKPFETREIVISFHVNSPIEIPAINNGDILKYIATIKSSETDEMPIDNTFTLNQTVVGSYDPNDKTCLEGDVITPSLIGEYVHYLIRFENTGTYPAENIVVKDMIDLSKFDISTLVPTSASHSYTTKISDGNKVEFIFEKINLPFDDATNDGYIAFKIKTLPTLSVGDSFTNEANIYFDYNFPILTNKATSTFKALGTQDFEFSNYFKVYPNPAKDILNISSNNAIDIQSMSVYDILGQLVIAVPNAKNVSNIDVSKLKTGNYLLRIKTEKGISATKFIKE